MRAKAGAVAAGAAWICLSGVPCAAHAGASRAEQIRNEARRILASPEFRDQSLRIPILEKAAATIRRGLRAIGDWLDRMFGAGRRAGRDSAAALWAIFTALTILLAYLLAAAIIRLPALLGRRPPASAPSSASLRGHPRDPHAWMAMAREALAGGDYRAAFRSVFLAILLQMDRTGVIRYREPATNGEYLAALSKRPDLQSVLRPIASEFDAYWYGFRAVSRQQVERAIASFDVIRKLTDAHDASEGMRQA